MGTCQISTALGQSITFQLNPVDLHVTSRADEGDFRSLRGGHFNSFLGPYPERITMHVEAPAQRGSFPGTYTDADRPQKGYTPAEKGWVIPYGPPEYTVDAWHDPQDYIHPLQQVINEARGRVFINFPDCDIFNWYLVVGIDEHHQGGYGDLGIDYEFVLSRPVPLLQQADANQQGAAAPSDSAPPPPPEVTTNSGALTPVPDGTPQPGQQYTVQDGDTLSGIAERAYGDPQRWVDIYNNNQDALRQSDDLAVGPPDPSMVVIGAVLDIP
jgi:LysM repeat protein